MHEFCSNTQQQSSFILHTHTRILPSFLPPVDAIIMNNTRTGFYSVVFYAPYANSVPSSDLSLSPLLGDSALCSPIIGEKFAEAISLNHSFNRAEFNSMLRPTLVVDDGLIIESPHPHLHHHPHNAVYVHAYVPPLLEEGGKEKKVFHIWESAEEQVWQKYRGREGVRALMVLLAGVFLLFYVGWQSESRRLRGDGCL